MRDIFGRIHDVILYAHTKGWLMTDEFHSGTGKTACVVKDRTGKFYRIVVEEMEHLNEQGSGN